MAKPALFAVDDDPEVLRAVELDLRRKYGETYRILKANSGASALDALQQLKQRGDAVALLLVDQRMPQMTGVSCWRRRSRSIPAPRRSCSPPTPTPTPPSAPSTPRASTTTS